MKHELVNIQNMLTKDYETADMVKKEKKPKLNSVQKLSNTLKTYKRERLGAEEDLEKVITKVELDK